MNEASAPTVRVSLMARLAAAVERAPGRTLAIVLGFHLLTWTLLPAFICPNLQLDLAEDLALGKEWQLGYWKHPPLPWWMADALYRLTGQVDSIYLLGPLAGVLCLYGVWLLAREIVSDVEALVAVVALEGIHFYNFSVVKFAHDQVQLPFWAFTAVSFYRALTRHRLVDWALAGALLAGAFWSKYAAFALAATLALFLLADPVARRAWRTPGPYVMAVTFLIVLAPNLWWLVSNDFMPFHYVDDRARVAARWFQYLVFPLQWTAGQALVLLPAAGLLWLYANGRPRQPVADDRTAFNRRYVTWLALAPFLVTTALFALPGRLLITMWGYPLWSFAPLAALMWYRARPTAPGLKRFAVGFAVVMVAWPSLYAAIELGESLVRDRPKASQFPGQTMADIITREWRERYNAPLLYAGGTELAVNSLAVYSADHPHVIPHGEPQLAPWVDMNDVRRRGAVLVWEDEHAGARPADWRRIFGTLEIEPTLVLGRQTLYPVKPARIVFAFVPPQVGGRGDGPK